MHSLLLRWPVNGKYCACWYAASHMQLQALPWSEAHLLSVIQRSCIARAISTAFVCSWKSNGHGKYAHPTLKTESFVLPSKKATLNR